MPQQEGEIDLAAARLVPPRIVRQLDMADPRQMLLQRARQVTFHHLGMVDVVLQPEVVAAHRLQHGQPGARVCHQEARRVARVERLQHQFDAGAGGHSGGEAQILDQGFPGLFMADLARRYAGQAVEAGAAQQARILDGLADPVLELGDAPWMAGDATFAGGPVARGQVEQHDLETRGQHHLGQRRAVELVGKVKLNGGKTGRLCRRETLEKRALGK